jgi:hypothetical protein
MAGAENAFVSFPPQCGRPQLRLVLALDDFVFFRHFPQTYS